MTTVVPPDRWAQRHAGHTVTRDRRGHRRCLTCPRTWAVDSVAVQRAVEGDPPPRLTPPERAAAVLVLRGRGLSVMSRVAGSRRFDAVFSGDPPYVCRGEQGIVMSDLMGS